LNVLLSLNMTYVIYLGKKNAQIKTGKYTKVN